jgi:hypothetical protein
MELCLRYVPLRNSHIWLPWLSFTFFHCAFDEKHVSLESTNSGNTGFAYWKEMYMLETRDKLLNVVFWH